MDADDRESNGFSEIDQDEVMEDVDEPEPDPDPEPEPEEEEDEQYDDDDADAHVDVDPESGNVSSSARALSTNLTTDADVGAGAARGVNFPGDEGSAQSGHDAAGADATNIFSAAEGTAVDSPETMAATASRKSAAASFHPRLRIQVRPEALTAQAYDIVPTMAAPQATSINALAVTPDLRYWITGGSDCYIRKYDGPGTINGRQLLTVAQRHPFVDSVVKAGILMSYWENEEPPTASARGAEEHILSPVYSLAVHSRALWLLSGTEGGSINLQSVRHDEGKRITCLQRHTNAVSVLQLAPDEKTVLSGSWDKNIFDWDLNTAQVRRQFDGGSGQISAIELRPASGAPIPTQSSSDEAVQDYSTGTFSTSNNMPLSKGVAINDTPAGMSRATGVNGDASVNGVSAAMNGDDIIPDHESLFGSTGGSPLFGGSDGMGPNPFGDDDIGTAVDITNGAGAIEDEYVDMTLGDGETTADVFAPTDGAPTGIPPTPTTAQAIANGAVSFATADANARKATDDTGPGTTTSPGAVQSVEAAAGGGEPEAAGGATSEGFEPDGDSLSSVAQGAQVTKKGDYFSSAGSMSPTQQRSDEAIQMQLLQTQPAGSSAPLAIKSESFEGSAKPDETTTAALASSESNHQSPQLTYLTQTSPPQFDPTQVSETVFFSASIDGTIRIWDRRQSLPVARVGNRPGVPPWCMGACWSPDGNRIYAGRRNGMVEEFDIHKARSVWQPERALRFPAGSGPVSAVRALANGRHLICASYDILRLYDLQDNPSTRHSNVPFLIVPGPPRPGVTSHLYVDPSSRFMISTAGTRGWEGTNTEVLVGYEISCVQK